MGLLVASSTAKQMNKTLLDKFQDIISYHFSDPQILSQSLTHRSYLNENRHLKLSSNERYEFLGDAILEFWVSQKLFQSFPNLPEGDLTNLRALIVCTDNLFQIATEINLGDYLFLSRGEAAHGGRSNGSILADTFESLIGAIFLDAGLKETSQFLERFLEGSISLISQKQMFKDPKSLFQEIAQREAGVTPHYKTLEETGPDHRKTFKVGVYLGNKLIATGEGNSKQKAEEAAVTGTKILNFKS